MPSYAGNAWAMFFGIAGMLISRAQDRQLTVRYWGPPKWGKFQRFPLAVFLGNPTNIKSGQRYLRYGPQLIERLAE